jgi:hypothetical protein
MAKHLVEFYESERGWGSETWVTEYDTYEQAQAVVYECNYKYMGKSVIPDYYIKATYKGEK